MKKKNTGKQFTVGLGALIGLGMIVVSLIMALRARAKREEARRLKDEEDTRSLIDIDLDSHDDWSDEEDVENDWS